MTDVAIAKEFEGQLWVTAEYHVRAQELLRQAMKAAAFGECSYATHLEGTAPNVRVVVMRHSPGQLPVEVARLPIDTSPSAPRLTGITCSKCGANRLREACLKPLDCAFKAHGMEAW